MSEKREHTRVGISFPVECDFLTKNCYFYTVSKDMSSGGVKIVTDDFIPMGNSLKLNINLIEKVVRLKAKVAWCNKERANDRYSVGLQFSEISDTNKRSIDQFLNQIYNY
ncbi:MAG: PilZ domain-containing protein [Candidatus Omnitrophica bacterium]|nr:PilZ domain-containing protein [Candidatus Omnitrophota bacterium]